MGTFFNASDTIIKTLTMALGERIHIISYDESQVFPIYALYENYYYEMQDGGVPVQVDSPSFLVRNKDVTFTDQFPLNRKEWKIRRTATGVTYVITDYERDEASAVRYLLAEENES